MQATVRDWDPEQGGSAFLDDGTVVVLPAECLQGSAFRFLRPGQRVQLTVQDGLVATVALPGT
jgi:hypothetical protein